MATTISGSSNSSFGGTIDSTGIDDNATSTAVTIDSSGNLLVGKTSVGISSAGFEAVPAGTVSVTRADTTLQLNRLTTDGEIANFRKDNSTVGSIGTNSTANFRIHSSQSGHSGLEFGTAAILPSIEGVLSNGGVDLGISSLRFKELYLSGGVVFGDAGGSGTPTSNTLDSYEEGTWTPTIEGSTTAGSYAGKASNGYYQKVGNTVRIQGYFYGTNGTGSGSLVLTGLPFSNVATSYISGNIQANGNLPFPSGTITAPLYSTSSTQFIVRCTKHNAAYGLLAYPSDANYIRFEVTYRAN